MGNKQIGTGSNDSLRHRDKYEDSITISFRYPDSSKSYKIDSSISDFSKRFPVPAHHIYLGNVGNASRSILFSPAMKPGWDPGFHAFDVYKWKLERVRFFNTTRPYTELTYQLGSRVEQIIQVLHSQNIKPNWNALFQYRLINTPGFFQNQKTNHNNYLFTSWYQGKAKRYNNYFVILSNNIKSSENGGIQDDQDYLNNPIFTNRFDIPVKLGGNNRFGRNFFSTNITTGNLHKESTALLRQQYDLGKKDSLVTDSTVIPLFYPRLRFEHTISYNSYDLQYLDTNPDSAYYKDNYGIDSTGDTLTLRDKWKEIIN
ncbi:MAG: putative porin, partial [Bacteroidota bacterium]|nr:putative porin [Bacteroidota bacterium]